jgi:hypothetical protein
VHPTLSLSVFAIVLAASARAKSETLPSDTTTRPTQTSAVADREFKARVLFESGVRLSNLERWEEAERSFTESHKLVRSVNCLLNLAVTRFHLNRPLEGLAALSELETLGEVISTQQAERAQAIRERLEKIVSVRIIRVHPEHADLRIDGHLLHTDAGRLIIKLNPGRHSVALTAVGYVPIKRELEVPAGSSEDLEFKLTYDIRGSTPPSSDAPRQETQTEPRLKTVDVSSPSPPSSPYQGLLIGELALTGVGLCVGIGFAVLGRDDTSDSNEIVSTVGFVGAGIGAAASLITFLVWENEVGNNARLQATPLHGGATFSILGNF